ncbi:hypothetical protein CLV51_103724 [Chitinophaga niastensis]|uniref:Outer membrane protein n=1 Tax=Chitinophaga niastensis TaxID=536980 RepID=A0A2P8HKJ8_CHINA|nr:hypothetical protein CLV51_103724 [Chitinophaga niastensis]
MLCSHVAASQSLAELEKQLDSLLRKEEKSEVVLGVGYGNNPAYGSKTTNFELPIILKTFVSPSLSYYHKSGFYAGVSAYYLFNSLNKPWFEWDLTAGYDYTKNKNFLTGISYTHYEFTDSSDVPTTPITNELFAYFYYRKWWVQPGVSLDYGWGKDALEGNHTKETFRGNDFNFIAALRHPFIFNAVMSRRDVVLFTPSVNFTMGTANYYSNLKAFQYVTRSPKLKQVKKHPGKELNFEDHSNFEARAIDVTLNLSYFIGRLNLAPSFTVFKPFSGTEQNIMSYFTARMAYSF